jgi:hypothetical protein
LAPGTINIAGTETSGSGWYYNADNHAYTILDGADITVSGFVYHKRIEVTAGATATVTLSNAEIHWGYALESPFGVHGGADVTLILEGENKLMSSSTNGAGLYVPVGAKLTIENGSSSGTLFAFGTGDSAAIGGEGIGGSGVGTIIIKSGTITAQGGVNGGAGIGRRRRR